MRAVVCDALGPVSGLRIDARDDPTPSRGQVLIAVEAAGVNYVDALFVEGTYQIKPPLPFVPGSEVAGTIAAVGAGVDPGRLGERVVCMCGLGGYAEQIVVPAEAAVPIPESLDAARAAAFVQSFCTARFALHDRAGIASGDTVLVLGGGGGVGQATIAVAVAAGASVVAVASSPDKQAAAAAAGAETVLDSVGRVVASTDEQFAAPDGDDDRRLLETVRAWSGGGVDIVLDPVGGPATAVALRALRERGRLLIIGFASGEIPALPANHVLLRNRSVLGVDWGAWAMQHPLEQRALLDALLDDVAAGRLTPSEPSRRPLAEAASALDDLVHRRVTGKVVLVP